MMGLVFAGVYLLAWLLPPRLEPVADPTDDCYVPRPEWYFLGWFQLLRYLPGSLESVGALLLPALGILLLFLIPWLDRSRERRVLRRPVVTGVGTAGLLGFVLLTALGLADRPRNVFPESNPFRAAPTALLAQGERLYKEQNCGGCHRLGDLGSETGLTLDRVGRRRRYDVDWMIRHFREPAAVVAGSTMPAYRHLLEAELRALTAFLFAERFNWPEAGGGTGSEGRGEGSSPGSSPRP
jgi:mono/diheme cytochrome c family protein